MMVTAPGMPAMRLATALTLRTVRSSKTDCRRIANGADGHVRRGGYTTKDIRNIGIMAHIDAGKTTLAEALLALTRNTGAMRNGAAATAQLDYMEQEIKRGITIRAACSSFNWNGRHVNIVDTPGHTDFSGEVYAAMDVIDGCVIVVDGTKGVQAQTRHITAALPRNMPKIIFVNKMDRQGASVDDNIHSIKKHLRLNTVLLNGPRQPDAAMNAGDGAVSFIDCEEEHAPNTKQMVDSLVESLCDLDDQLAEHYLNHGTPTKQMIIDTLRKHVQTGCVAPVVCGSATTLCGVKHLIDFVCALFPEPAKINSEKQDEIVGNHIYSIHDTQTDTLLYTFKTVSGEAQRINAFCKILAGTMTPNTRLYNLAMGKAEHTGKIHKIHGNTYTECTKLVQGDIGMIEGMHEVRTGHILARNPRQQVPEAFRTTEHITCASAKCVCFASFSPKGENTMEELVETMGRLKIEDPSLHYKYDPDALEALVVGGYGEFHLEILAEILKDNHAMPVKISKVKVAFKETPMQRTEASMFVDNDAPEDRTHIGIQLIMEPMETQRGVLGLQSPAAGSDSGDEDGNVTKCQVDDKAVVFVNANGTPVNNQEELRQSTKARDIVANVKQLLMHALEAGPMIGGAMIATKVTIAKIKIMPHSTVAGAKIIASKVLKNIYANVPIELQQPMIALNIVLPTEYVGNVVPDLRNNRKADILRMEGDDAHGAPFTTIVAKAPMKELLGYTGSIRALTNGNATFTMVPCGYAPAQLHEVE